MQAFHPAPYSRFFLGLSALYVTCLLVSNLIAGKLWSAGGFVLPAAVVLFPVTYILGDVFTEVYGFKKARSVIWAGFFCSFLAAVFYMVAVALPAPSFWHGQEAYATVLGMTPRVAAASFLGYLAGEFSNSVVLSRLKVATQGRMLWLRTIGSTVIGEGLDSVLFITAAFWGTMPPAALGAMILTQYCFKVAYEVLCTPLTYAAVGWIKRREGVDAYDTDARYALFGD